jgi:hypothetical protein
MRYTKLLIAGLTIIPALVFGQQSNFEIGIKAGAASGLCDIGGISTGGRPWVLDMQTSQIRWDLGFYARFKIARKFNISGHFDYIRLQGFDSLSKYAPIRDRNLNYQNDILEGSVRGEWTFYDNPDVGGNFNYTTTFTAYLFAGVGVYHMNPEAMITHTWTDATHTITYTPGQYYELHTLTTEGEPEYSLIQAAIPMGVGFYYTFNKAVRLGWELCWDKTFTDYIDDVSKTYPKFGDSKDLPNTFDKYLSNQTQYVPNLTRSEIAQYGPGSPRGNPKNNDSFVTTAITLGFMINPKLSKHMRKNFFEKNNYKSRASF